MSARAAIRRADARRIMEAAKEAGLSFVVEFDGLKMILRPVDGPAAEDEAARLERKMAEAFGE